MIRYLLLLGFLILLIRPQGFSQCNSGFQVYGDWPSPIPGGQAVTTSNGCTTWSGSYNGWTVTHGAPFVQTNGYVSGVNTNNKDPNCLASYGVHLVDEFGRNNSAPPNLPVGGGGSGIRINCNFQAGQSYDIRVLFFFECNFFVDQSLQEQGWLEIYAAGIAPGGDLANCREAIPSTSGQILIKEIPLLTASNDAAYDVLINYKPTTTSGELWIFPKAQDPFMGQNENPQTDVIISNIFVCPSCPSGTVKLNSGTLPLSENVGTIFAGTSTVDGGNGTGTVSNQATQSSTWAAGDFIELDPGFVGTASGTGSLILSISPCSNPSDNPRPDFNDSTNIMQGHGPIVTQTLAATPQLEEKEITAITEDSIAATTSPPATPATPSGLVVYPTVGNGSFTISGASQDLTNADILVTDQTWKVLYRTYNESATSISVNLNNPSQGIYFVEIRQSGKMTTRKIIVTR